MRCINLLRCLGFTVCLCNSKDTLFTALGPDETGIHFSNSIRENDSINPIDITNIYNGGGVGVEILITTVSRIFISPATWLVTNSI